MAHEKAQEEWEALTDRLAKEGEFRSPLYTDRADLMEAVGKDMLPSFDPIAIEIVVGDMPTVTAEEIGADVVGFCGCPGIAEGIARVIMDAKDLGQLKAGEILICPGTNPEWTIALVLQPRLWAIEAARCRIRPLSAGNMEFPQSSIPSLPVKRSGQGSV